MPERVAVEELELAEEVVHVVFADVVEDDALRLKGQEAAAQLAADGPAAAGDEHGFPAEERGDLRHVQLLLGAAQEVADVDVAHQRGGHGGVASQLLQGREAAHAAAGGQAFFDEGLEVALGRGDGDDDFIHAVVAGELEDVARPAHHGHAAELRAGADAVVVHHEHGRAVAVAAALHLMHDARAGPARAHHHHAAHVVARRAQEGEALVGDQNAVEKPGGAHQRHRDNPKQQIDHPVQAKEVFGAHKDVGRQRKHIGEQRRHQRGQGDAQHVVCGGILPHRAVHAKGAEHQQKNHRHGRRQADGIFKKAVGNIGGIPHHLRQKQRSVDKQHVKQHPQKRARRFFHFGTCRSHTAAPSSRHGKITYRTIIPQNTADARLAGWKGKTRRLNSTGRSICYCIFRTLGYTLLFGYYIHFRTCRHGIDHP